MKTQGTRQPTTILLIFIFVSVFGIGTSSSGISIDTFPTELPKVHALLVLLGNDRGIRVPVEKNEEKMVNMLKQLSHHCNVQLTLMHSKSAHEGTVSHKTFVKGRSENATTHEQDIIQSHQIAKWLGNLTPNPEDTVLIYYSGHGKIDSFGTHSLVFDPGLHEDTPDRGKLSQKLKDKPARLRMLITDTCSELSQDLSDDTFVKFAVSVRAKARPYIQDLFLEHEGFLDITAASPGQLAIGNDELGGHFTSALLSQGFAAVADTDRDGFLSWQEVFDKSVAQTKELYQKATFGAKVAAEFEKNRQTTQEPLAYSPLPTRIGGGGPPVQSPTRAVAVLNFTSVPSGAEVSIDGFVVGQTPLKGYELETDGRSTKDIEVTVKAEGYADAVKKFKVRRGHPFPWEFKLTGDIPKTITGRDGAEMVLIPAGEFQMGSNYGDNDEKPVHTVYVDGFYMDKYEVTVGQYKQFIRATGHRALSDGISYYSPTDKHPVVKVNWHDAMAYAQWAGKRLPTEAEWEKAARGGLVGKTYPWGNAIDSNKANYGRNVGETTAVGKYPPNGYGLCDMVGNVQEWCLDEYNEGFYKSSPSRNPISGDSISYVINNFTNVKTSRVLRGGSWGNSPKFVRVANRNRYPPTGTDTSGGFRCVRAQ